MYYGSTGGFDVLFSKKLWAFILVAVALGAWKVIDIIIWLCSHINISWS